MLRLLRENLRYHWGLLAVTVAVGMVPASLVGIVLLTSRAGPQPVVVSLLFSMVVASGVAAFIVIGRDAGEHRPVLHLLLGVPLRAVALSRVLTPVVLQLAGSAAAMALALGAFVVLERERYDRLVAILPFVAAQLLFVGQLVLAAQEILAARRDRRGHLWPAALAALLAALAFFAWVEVFAKTAMGWKTGLVLALTAVLGLGNLALFERRRSFVR